MMPMEQRSVRKFNGALAPRERDLRLWWRCLGCVLMGIVIIAGFALALQQHFAAHEFSVKNVELQRERERLKTEQKRLLLERETAFSLNRLKQKAEKIGLQEPTVNQITSFEQPRATLDNPQNIAPQIPDHSDLNTKTRVNQSLRRENDSDKTRGKTLKR